MLPTKELPRPRPLPNGGARRGEVSEQGHSTIIGQLLRQNAFTMDDDTPDGRPIEVDSDGNTVDDDQPREDSWTMAEATQEKRKPFFKGWQNPAGDMPTQINPQYTQQKRKAPRGTIATAMAATSAEKPQDGTSADGTPHSSADGTPHSLKYPWPARDWVEVSAKGIPKIMLERGTTVRMWHPEWEWFECVAGQPGYRELVGPDGPYRSSWIECRPDQG